MGTSDELRPAVTRSEYIAAIALGLNLLTMAFGAGVYVTQIQTQGRAIEELKTARANDRREFDDLKTIVTRIDVNVATLAERAREDRQLMEIKR